MFALRNYKKLISALLVTIIITTACNRVAGRIPVAEGGFVIDKNGVITGYKGKGGDIVIPDTINGIKITAIGERAFLKCESLISITIPYSVTSIGELAFVGCRNLNKISIPDSVTSIGKIAFSGCESLTSINIPSGVTKIEDYTFVGCISLKSITIPERVTSIGNHAFNHCVNLSSITISDSVASIRESAFWGCENLKNITIPSSVTRIDRAAFAFCDNLAECIFLGNAPENFGYFVFDDAHYDFKIYYSETSKGFTTPEWNGYPCYPVVKEKGGNEQ